MGQTPPFSVLGGSFGVTGSPSVGWAFTRTAQASAAETPIVAFGVSDGSGSLIVENASATDAIFSPRLRGVGQTTGSAFTLMGQGVTDTGTNGVMQLVSRISTSTLVATRPLVTFSNHSTEVMQITAAGGLKIQGGSTPSILVGASGTAITQMRVYTPTIDPASVAANTTVEQTFTVTGLTTADKVIVNKPTNTAGLGIVNVRVSAADTLALTFGNFTAAPIDAASEVYSVIAIRS